jgi:hypothetical protein
VLVVRNIEVYSLDRDLLTVSWEITPTSETLSDYTIAVLRSGAPGGPYTVVSQEMDASQVSFFEDRGVNLLSKWREHYYRIRVTDTGDSSTQEYGSTDPQRVIQDGVDPQGVVMAAPPDLIAVEAIRRFQLILDEYNAREVLLLKRRSWGQRCTDCVDPLTNRRTKSDCKSCYGTMWTGGYFYPQKTRVLKPPHKVMVQAHQLFEMEPKDAVMWINGYRRVTPRDLIIDTENNRWRVIAIARSEKGQALTRQTVQVRQLSRDQIEYGLPIEQSSWGETPLSSGSHREYVRATDIDSYYEAVDDLGFTGTTPNQITGFPADRGDD